MEELLKVTKDYLSMHDSVHNLGKQSTVLDGIPRVALAENNPWSQCKKKVLIVFQSRVGTTWLCQLMKNTSLLGRPRELFHSNNLLEEFESGGYDNFNELMKALVSSHTTENGVFSAKSGFHTLAPLFLLKEFPNNIRTWKIIFVKRRDVLSQAISCYKLNLNRQAASWQESKMNIVDENYDFNEISRQMRNIGRSRYITSMMLKSYDCDYLEIFYEDLNADPEAILRSISQFVGVKLGEIDLETRFEIQRDEISAIWKKRWLAESLECNPLNQRVQFFE